MLLFSVLIYMFTSFSTFVPSSIPTSARTSVNISVPSPAPTHFAVSGLSRVLGQCVSQDQASPGGFETQALGGFGRKIAELQSAFTTKSGCN